MKHVKHVNHFTSILHGLIRTNKWPAPNVPERRTGIARSRVQTTLKSWLFQASVRNCLNCVQNCDDHGLLNDNNKNFIQLSFLIAGHTCPILIGETNQMLVFGERGKPEYSGKNLQEQSGKPTNSIPYDSRFWKSNPHDIGGRRVLSIINSILERVTTNKQALVKSNLNNNATKLQQPRNH